MYYKVKHKETGLYYQPTTSSGSNLGKNGKITELSKSMKDIANEEKTPFRHS